MKSSSSDQLGAQPPGLSALTLVELLVVISIIGILASLLLTGLASARDRADLAVCRNNLRQCTMAMSMYVTDNDSFPMDYNWIARILPYLSLGHLIPQIGVTNTALSNTVVSCPGFNRMPGTYSQDGSSPFGYNGAGTSPSATGISWGLLGKYAMLDRPDNQRPTRESDIVSPSDMICLADAQIFSPTGQHNNVNPPFVCGGPGLDVEIWFGSGSAADKYYERRHRRLFWNISFVDAHIETKKAADLFDPSNLATRARWNRDFKPH